MTLTWLPPPIGIGMVAGPIGAIPGLDTLMIAVAGFVVAGLVALGIAAARALRVQCLDMRRRRAVLESCLRREDPAARLLQLVVEEATSGRPPGGAMPYDPGRSASSVEADGAGWYAVETKRHQEGVALGALARREIHAYLPRLLEWPPRRPGATVEPMFPGYLFVYADLRRDFHRVAWSQGVKHFVSLGDAPAAVEPSVIEYLRSLEDADGVIRRQATLPAGRRVRIAVGPLSGLTAVVERRVRARDRIVVLLELLHREVRVELPARAVTTP